jgi:hypothetical protein
MGKFGEFRLEDKVTKRSTLHINKSKKKITGIFSTFRFIDRDTNQHVLYIPSFEISGYGDTYEKAEEMIKFSIDEFFHKLFEMPPNALQIELSKTGWKRDAFRSKDFSKAYVDLRGQLQNLNAVPNTIEQVSLVA